MIHSEASSLREQYIEYGFLADLCREMWRRGTAVDAGQPAMAGKLRAEGDMMLALKLGELFPA